MSSLYCSAIIATDANGVPMCVDSMGVAVAWTIQPEFDVSQVMDGEAAGYFGAGFGIVTVCYALGHCIRAILSLLR